MPTLTFTVLPTSSGERLDRWLTDQLAMRSRHEIQRWIDQRGVRLNGRVAKGSYKIEAGDEVRAEVPDDPAVSSVLAEDIPLPLLYEDNDLLVIDKPAGMAVHPSPGHERGTVLNAVQHLLRNHEEGSEGVGGERRPGLVHRLDMDTSGILVVAKNDRVLRDIQEQFKRRIVYKEYLALVEGRLHPESGRIAAPIGPHPTIPRSFAVLPGMYKWVDDKLVAGIDGKAAVTDYWTVATYEMTLAAQKLEGGNLPGRLIAQTTSVDLPFPEEVSQPFSLLRIELHTGRTHQIRVHLAWRKHPIVGDTLYGPNQPRLPITRQFLHAHKLRFKLPKDGQVHEFVSPLPAELQAVLERAKQVRDEN